MGQERRRENKRTVPTTGSLRARLQKYLAQCGVASRRAAEEMIKAGKVSVNGEVVRELGSSVDPRRDEVRVDGRRIGMLELGIMLLHKPRNVVCTLSDPEGRPSLLLYLTKQTKSYFPVGRLDFESTGLVILTNDGELAQYLLHPRYEAHRVYEVVVEGYISDAKLQIAERGVKLEDGIATAKVHVLSREDAKSYLRVIIQEGRNRIIRRIFFALGSPVLELKRMSHGPFRLGHLRPGERRRLTNSEYQRFRTMVFAAAKAAGTSNARKSTTKKSHLQKRPIRNRHVRKSR